MKLDKLNLAEAFGSFSECWSPQLVGQINDCAVKLAKLEGDFIWHHHEHEDELFLVVKGTLTMHVREGTHSGGEGQRSIEVGQGELIVIPRGLEHKSQTADGEVWVQLGEPTSTLNTGNVENERTIRTLKTLH